jgi:hypothetical protein
MNMVDEKHENKTRVAEEGDVVPDCQPTFFC